MNNSCDNWQGISQPRPGRKIREVERVWFPSGRYVDYVRIEATVLDRDGNYFTQVLTHVFPPPDDGSCPESPAELVECCRPGCRRIVAEVSSFQCAACLGRFCQASCGVLVEVEEGKTVVLCPECAAAAKHPWRTRIVGAVRRIWE